MSRQIFRRGMFFCLTLGLLVAPLALAGDKENEGQSREKEASRRKSGDSIPTASPIPNFANSGIAWLIKAQHPNGGWGAGSHANQQNRDPHKVQVDPATTSFVCTTLLRAGSTPVSGEHKDAVRRATEYLCGVIEKYDKPGPKITDITGTQIQAKLGPLVDTVMTTHYLARVLNDIPENDPLRKRVDRCLDGCIAKLEEAQGKDGSWNLGGGWAPVLQSSVATSALEVAEAAGKKVDASKLEKARDYQKGNFDRKTGQINARAGAGVALYALSSSQRANAAQARAAGELIRKAKREGVLKADAPVTAENLRKLGVDESKAVQFAEANADVLAQNQQIGNEQILKGFGNNGGEEFLSYLQTSESLVIVGGKKWKEWNAKMNTRLAKVQSKDGSWSGHHCITSPVFCTAAVVQCVTTDRDADMLIKIAERTALDSKNGAVRTARNK